MYSNAKARALIRDLSDRLGTRLAFGGTSVNSFTQGFSAPDAAGGTWPYIVFSQNGNVTEGQPVVYIQFSNPNMQSADVFGGQTDAYAPTIAQIGYELNAISTFAVTSANATAGAVYSNNGQNFTVTSTIAAGTTLFSSASGLPLASGTLTKVSGTGDATITFSAAASAFGTFPSHVDLATICYETEKTGCRIQIKELPAGTAVTSASVNAAAATDDLEDLYWPTKSV